MAAPVPPQRPLQGLVGSWSKPAKTLPQTGGYVPGEVASSVAESLTSQIPNEPLQEKGRSVTGALVTQSVISNKQQAAQ
jgi:hypothetical protein